MARDHSRTYVSIWDDTDWTDKLDQTAQHIYWMFKSQRRLSYAGVLDYIPSRYTGCAKGLTEAKIKTGVRTLERHRFVVIDRGTHELLIRSYVRHDGVLNRANMGKACARAFNNVISEPIKEAILRELGRLYHEDPNLAGWIGFREESPEAFAMASAIASLIASGEA